MGGEVERPAAVLRPVQAGRMARAGRRRGDRVACQRRRRWRAARPVGRTRPASPPAPAARELVASFATPTESATSRRSISTNRPDSGRSDQSALAVTWNSTMRPAPRGACRDQRRAVGEARPGLLGQMRPRLGQHLARSPAPPPAPRGPANGEFGGNGGEAGRLAPGQRAAELPVAGEQLHRQQRRPGARRCAGPAKRTSSPPFSTQAASRSRSGPSATTWSASTSTDRSRASSVSQVALAHLGVRRQRPAQVERLAEQRRLGGGGVAGQHADRAPAPALVEQHHRAGGGLALQHQPGQPVAELRAAVSAAPRRSRHRPAA